MIDFFWGRGDPGVPHTIHKVVMIIYTPCMYRVRARLHLALSPRLVKHLPSGGASF